jgi:hypothetical protein
MEALIPVAALFGLYSIAGQSKAKSDEKRQPKEGFLAPNQYNQPGSALPNTDVQDRNYPPELSFTGETDKSSKISTVNKNTPPYRAYTDKYFSPDNNYLIQQSAEFAEKTGKQYTSLEGKAVDYTHFTHSNMAPFFGSKTYSNHQTFNSNEGRLDTMVGSGSVSYAKNKQEIAPMFKPSAGNQWAHGTPNMNDYMQSRQLPSMNRAGERPGGMEQVYVAPGLGLGPTNEGNLGFNSGLDMRDSWRDKTVDEMRVSTNPKASDGRAWGHEGPAMSSITKRGIHGAQQKNGPETTFETGADRWLTTTGAISGVPSARQLEMDRKTSRQTQSNYLYEGAAQSQVLLPGQAGAFQTSTNIELGAVPLGVASAPGKQSSPMDADYEARSMSAYQNNRSTAETYFGAMGGVIGAVIAPLMDVLKPTRKDNAVGNMRPYGAARPTNLASSYFYDPDDVPETTMRELGEHGSGHLFVDRGQIQQNDAYSVTNQEMRPQQRDTTTDYGYAGGSSAGVRALRPIVVDNVYSGSHDNAAKDSVVQQTGFLPGGHADTYYSDLGITRPTAKDSNVRNTRAPIRTDGPRYMPSSELLGEVQERNPQRSEINVERTAPDLLAAYRSNPFTQFRDGNNKSVPSMI